MREPTAAGSKLRLSAILVGLTVDVMGSTFAGFPLIALFGVDPTNSEAVAQLTASTGFLLASLPLGLLFTAAGGYVAAHLAQGSELNNAFVMGVASTIVGLVLTVADSPPPLWYLAASVVTTVPVALAAGYLRAATRK